MVIAVTILYVMLLFKDRQIDSNKKSLIDLGSFFSLSEAITQKQWLRNRGIGKETLVATA